MEATITDMYVKTFEKWSRLANLSEWGTWSEGVFARPKGYFYPNTIADLYELHGWMIGMEYRLPNQLHEFQAAFEEFRMQLSDLLYYFSNSFERSGQDGFYWITKNSVFNNYTVAKLDDHLSKNIFVMPDLLVERAMFGVSRAANHLIEQAMKDFGATVSRHRDKVTVKYLGGPHGNEGELCPELSDVEKRTVYEDWISKDRLNAIVDKEGNYVGSGFLPLFHRESKYWSN